MDNRENQENSEPLFGDDVYSLIRDDSLLNRVGSTGFASLISNSPVESMSVTPETILGQQVAQQPQPKVEFQEHQQQLPNQISFQNQQQIKQEYVQIQQETIPTQQSSNQNHEQQPQQQYLLKERIENGQSVLYRIPITCSQLTTNNSNNGIIVLTNSNNVNEPSGSNFTLQQQQILLQQQQQQQLHQQEQEEVGMSWDIDDGEEMLASNTDLPLINTEAFRHIFEESSSLIPDSTHRPVPVLTPWGGKYHFGISVPTDNRDRNKWCYSKEVKKLYVCPNVAVPVSIRLAEWIDANITITPVYQQSQHRMDPVTRCYNCKVKADCETELGDYIVQIEGEGCEYEVVHDRNVVRVPVQTPPPGENSSILLLKMMCLTSCVGGPNRRPFCLVLTLRCSKTGMEIGRQILDVKCCKCPSRDMLNDVKQVTPNNNGNRPAADDSKFNKIRKLSSEIKVEHKRKKPKIKLEPGTEQRYVNIAVPVEFELQVKSYVNGLIAEQIVRRNQPNMLLYPDVDNS